ncbi:MAG: alpha/beta fold hydrolase [Clostridia bacterium]|nr:alpha/beta fold hydrolase [Clostridia bacterium]
MLLEQIEQRYRQAVDSRVDDDGTVFYFSAADFAGLRRQAFAFPSSDGHTLQGYFYWYDRCKKDRLIVFDHGMGSGHRGYMIEIELMARRGFLVFAYDHTGCMESGGEGMGGFTQSLRDLNDALNALKSHETYGSLPIAVMGHSWGGYSVLNIAAYHPDVTHIVAMAGFISLENAIGQFFRGPLAYFGKRIYAKELAADPEFASANAIAALSRSNAKMLIMHSEDDNMVSFEKNFEVLRKALGKRSNITFLRLKDKRHNPNYTADAVEYKDEFFKLYKKVKKKGELTTGDEKQAFIRLFDWHRMTRQDTRVWRMIYQTLEN